MQDKIDRAIEVLTGKITVDVKPDEALKLTQSALNLAHVKAVLLAEERERIRIKRENVLE